MLAIASTPAGVLVTIPGEARTFDRVVLAAHSDTAMQLITSPTTEQRRILGAIRY